MKCIELAQDMVRWRGCDQRSLLKNMFVGTPTLSFSLKVKKYNAPVDVQLLTFDKLAVTHQLFTGIRVGAYRSKKALDVKIHFT
jgi:hypothetical protein